jgi:spore coat protein A
MITRRQFLKTSALAGAGLLLPVKVGAVQASAPVARTLIANAALPGGTQNPKAIPKYAMPLVIPPAMPITTVQSNRDYYEIEVRQFQQQILPTGMPLTTVWSYGSPNHPGSFNYPAFTIAATADRPVRVKWINSLKDASGKYLPHLLPVDPTLHWANPLGGIDGRDMRPTFTSTPGPYTGPVPIVTHVHGAHSTQESDGYAEAWYLPHAKNIPAGYAKTGTYYDIFKESSPLGADWAPGTAVFQYANDQRAATMWYHDHTLGMTRLNVYAGPAGFYLLRGGSADLPAGVLPGPAPALGDPPGTKYYEIPIAIQDRSFNADGSLFFPASRAFFDGFGGPYIPDSDISPIYNSEFFGNTMVVNGRTWPYLEVEPRRYRFRFLNGCNSRFLILKMVAHARAKRPATPALPFWQIGTEGGFLPAPVMLDQLLMGLAERADVIVDFTGLKVGTEIYLINEGPDEPFGGGEPGDEFEGADRHTTGQVMKFKVVPLGSVDTSVRPDQLTLPRFAGLGRPSKTRQVSLNEEDSAVLPGVGPRAALLGTLHKGRGRPLEWMAPITEHVALGATEVWEIYNFTADAHPIHIHEVQFQVVNRQALVTDAEGVTAPPARLVGDPLPPEAWETGFKDTVIAYPGQVTRIKATFDIAGRYVWHCHIVDHEDNEMMRPYRVG